MTERSGTERSRVPLRVWVVLVAGLAVLGTSSILIRYAQPAPGMALAAWRTLFSVLLAAPLAWAAHRRPPNATDAAPTGPLRGRDRFLVVAAGILLGLHLTLFVLSLYYTSVASSSVLVTTSPLFIAALGFFVLGERLGVRTVAAIVVAVAGAALLGVADAQEGVFPRAALGNALALAASFLVAVYFLIGRAVRQRVEFWAYLLPLYGVAAVTCWAGALVSGTPLAQPWPVLGLCLLMALGPQLLGHGAFNYAVRYLPAAVLGLLSLTEPVTASALAFVLFGETPAPLALGGMALVLGAIAGVLTARD
ncbi:MAG TPA: DMT family transporter [Rubricoccaceae bacterium]|nr:DMT family transporter [Rubricoccaceae bacterium]